MAALIDGGDAPAHSNTLVFLIEWLTADMINGEVCIGECLPAIGHNDQVYGIPAGIFLQGGAVHNAIGCVISAPAHRHHRKASNCPGCFRAIDLRASAPPAGGSMSKLLNLNRSIPIPVGFLSFIKFRFITDQGALEGVKPQLFYDCKVIPYQPFTGNQTIVNFAVCDVHGQNLPVRWPGPTTEFPPRLVIGLLKAMRGKSTWRWCRLL